MTIGEIMFYGGISGMILMTGLAVITWIRLVDARKQLTKTLNQEYGVELKRTREMSATTKWAYSFPGASPSEGKR